MTQGKSSLLHFLIVTYHPDDKFSKLRRILKNYPLLVIDNSQKNLGYAGAINQGFKKILTTPCKWIVILNQDLILSQHTIIKLKEKLSITSADIVGPFGGNLDAKRYTTILPGKETDDKNLCYLSGSFLAVKKEVFQKIGFWEEKYFLYYEDVDFCQKALKNNLTLEKITLPDIAHDESGSLGKNSFLHQYYLARNHLLFVEKHAPSSVKIHELLRLPKTIYEHWAKKEAGALLGIRDYLLRRSGKIRLDMCV
ncbi:glycosyltransferase family 2 protein [Candidatus Microgenomates bacterium]|nr:glycosyltransferase family 2 protein [Candidatus Microgenomates bacterium]